VIDRGLFSSRDALIWGFKTDHIIEKEWLCEKFFEQNFHGGYKDFYLQSFVI
jgi:hypothetical protein